MLKLNFLIELSNTLVPDLNTSYVEVKQIQLGTDTTLYANLNTSYVEVKRFIFLKILVILSI